MKEKASYTGAESMVRMLELYGVEYIFGLCGDTSLPFYDCMNRMKPKFKHILTRDERSAAYMADAYARISGKPGICEGPSGGGATYILPGLVEANESSVPVLAITSDVATHSRGKYPLTELDQKGLFRPVTKYNEYIDQAAVLPKLVRTAFRHMNSAKTGTAHLCFPINVQREDAVPSEECWVEEDLKGYPARRFAPSPEAVEKAVAIINQSKNPAILCGGGPVISGAFQEVQQFAEKTGAVVYTSISGKGIISEVHPLCAGVVGSNGGHPETSKLFNTHDLIIMLGCRAGSVTTEKWTQPKNHDVNIIQIDVDFAVLGANYKVNVALLSDAKLAMNSFLAQIESKSKNHIQLNKKRVKEAVQKKFSRFNELAKPTGKQVKPEMIVKCLQNLLSKNALIVADAGTPCPYFSAYYQLKSPGRNYFSNRAHGALGYSLSAAIGAAFAKPEAKTVAVMGDGSFGFCAGELETAARYKLPITFIVISNAVYGWIKAGQKTQFGKRYYSVDFNATDNSTVAKGFGVDALSVSKPEELEKALKTALESDKPFLVDIACQPLQEADAPVTEWIA